jgi:hypothetical protein
MDLHAITVHENTCKVSHVQFGWYKCPICDFSCKAEDHVGIRYHESECTRKGFDAFEIASKKALKELDTLDRVVARHTPEYEKEQIRRRTKQIKEVENSPGSIAKAVDFAKKSKDENVKLLLDEVRRLQSIVPSVNQMTVADWIGDIEDDLQEILDDDPAKMLTFRRDWIEEQVKKLKRIRLDWNNEYEESTYKLNRIKEILDV